MQALKIGYVEPQSNGQLINAAAEMQVPIESIQVARALAFNLISDGSLEAVVLPLTQVPYQLPEQIAITALLLRKEPRLALWVGHESVDPHQEFRVRHGALVAVAHEAIALQLRNYRPDLELLVRSQPVGYEAAIFPESAFNDEAKENTLDFFAVLEPGEMIPPPGAGVLAILCLRDQTNTRNTIKLLHHTATSQCTNIERGFERAFAVPVPRGTNREGVPEGMHREGGQNIITAAHVYQDGHGNYRGCFGIQNGHGKWQHTIITQTTFLGMVDQAIEWGRGCLA